MPKCRGKPVLKDYDLKLTIEEAGHSDMYVAHTWDRDSGNLVELAVTAEELEDFARRILYLLDV